MAAVAFSFSILLFISVIMLNGILTGRGKYIRPQMCINS